MAGGLLGSLEEDTRCQLDEDGVPVKRYQREYYYVCEGNKLAQTRLSFKRVTKLDKENADSLSTSTVGQSRDDTNKDEVYQMKSYDR